MSGKNLQEALIRVRQHLAAGCIPEALQEYATVGERASARLQRAMSQIFTDDTIAALAMLTQNRPDSNRLSLGQGLLYLEFGHVVEAERALRELAESAHSAAALTAYAQALSHLGQIEQALASFDAALRLEPTAARCHFERGRLLSAVNRSADALLAFAAACQHAPRVPEYWLEYGNLCKALNQPTAAIQAYTQAVMLRPDFAEAYNNRATVHREHGSVADALADFDRAINCNPRHLFAYLNRGALRAEMKNLAGARSDFEMALAIAPQDPNAHYGLGEVMHQMERHEEAIRSLDAAILLADRMPVAHLSRGNALQALNRFEDAISAYADALAAEPSFIEAYINWGNALQELGRHEEAIAILDRALEQRPDYAGASWNKANSMLCLGLAKTAWQTYEERHKLRPPEQVGHSDLPLLGERSPAGQTLLLHWDQRFGDILMSLRYAPLVEQSAKRCVWQIAEPMRDLVAESYPGIEIVSPRDFSHPVDYRLPITSLPLAMGTFGASRIPDKVPYLKAEAAQILRWRNFLGQDQPKVGLVWRGQPVPPGRSITLERLEPLLQTSGVQWHSLQLGLTSEERVLLMKHRVRSFDGIIKNFHDTAAILANLDLLITIDTSVAHLAGALGRPCWVLVKYGGDWRWHLQGESSDWYPTCRIFRQSRPRDWRDPIDQVLANLQDWIAQPSEAFDGITKLKKWAATSVVEPVCFSCPPDGPRPGASGG